MRATRCVADEMVTGQSVWLDGYNVLTTVEAALSGAVLLQGADETLRDMVSMHGNYRKVSETQPALGLIGQTLMERRPFEVRWLLDRPVSNSGRLRHIIEQVASERNWPWTVDLVSDPDPVLAESPAIVATADSAILDRCGPWLNLARRVVELHVPGRSPRLPGTGRRPIRGRSGSSSRLTGINCHADDRGDPGGKRAVAGAAGDPRAHWSFPNEPTKSASRREADPPSRRRMLTAWAVVYWAWVHTCNRTSLRRTSRRTPGPNIVLVLRTISESARSGS